MPLFVWPLELKLLTVCVSQSGFPVKTAENCFKNEIIFQNIENFKQFSLSSFIFSSFEQKKQQQNICIINFMKLSIPSSCYFLTVYSRSMLHRNFKTIQNKSNQKM